MGLLSDLTATFTKIGADIKSIRAKITGTEGTVPVKGTAEEGYKDSKIKVLGSQLLQLLYNQTRLGANTTIDVSAIATALNIVVESRSGEAEERLAFMSDIVPPVDTAGMEQYADATNYLEGRSIYDTGEDGKLIFYEVLQDFISDTPFNPDADIADGNVKVVEPDVAIKIYDHEPTSDIVYTIDSVVSHPTLPVIYKAKKNVPASVPLTDITAWRNITVELVNDLITGGTAKALTAEQGKVLKLAIDGITTALDNLGVELDTKVTDALTEGSLWMGGSDGKKKEVGTDLIIKDNDITVDLFTVSYLSGKYPDYKPGQSAECSQQIGTKTNQSWSIKNKFALSTALIDLDDSTFYNEATGVLDISTVNTANIIKITRSVGSTDFMLNKIVGGVENFEYMLMINTGYTATIHHTALASLGSGDIYIYEETDAVLVGNNVISDWFKFRVSNSFNIEVSNEESIPIELGQAPAGQVLTPSWLTSEYPNAETGQFVVGDYQKATKNTIGWDIIPTVVEIKKSLEAAASIDLAPYINVNTIGLTGSSVSITDIINAVDGAELRFEPVASQTFVHNTAKIRCSGAVDAVIDGVKGESITFKVRGGVLYELYRSTY